jgi:hypothetical protein
VVGGVEIFWGTGSQNIEIIGSNLFAEPLQNVFFKNTFSIFFWEYFLDNVLKGRVGSGNSTVVMLEVSSGWYSSDNDQQGHGNM